MTIGTKLKFNSLYKHSIKFKTLISSVLFAFTLSVALLSQGFTQSKPPPNTTRILFVLDGSQSMLGKWESGVKIKIAQKLLSNLVDSLKDVDNLQLALRVYGHQSPVPPQDCNDTKLEVPFSEFHEANIDKIKKKLSSISPRGTTPIAKSLGKAANDFPPCDHCRNIVILITDGIEACDGDPCAVSLALRKKGIVLKPFVIGMGLDLKLKEIFDCVGNFYNAGDESTFKSIINIVISQALHNTTAQVNLLDAYYRPTETNVNMTFYDAFSGRIKHNYIHTINHRGNPDTLYLDPLITYNIEVHTIPPVKKDSIKIIAGKHNIIAIDAPQGKLYLKAQGAGNYKNLKSIVRQQNKMQTLVIQDFNKQQKYIVGRYDLEIMCLPRIYIPDVIISQDSTTTVQIPIPGTIHMFFPDDGYGSVYVERNNRLDWVYNLKGFEKKESIVLQPGRYRVIYRLKNSGNTMDTIEKSFKIKSGISTSLKLY